MNGRFLELDHGTLIPMMQLSGLVPADSPLCSVVVPAGAELLALYNHPQVRDGHVKYYTVKVPLQVQNCTDGVRGVEANWLDHMTQHFNNGASLVDGYFHLGNVNGKVKRSKRLESQVF